MKTKEELLAEQWFESAQYRSDIRADYNSYLEGINDAKPRWIPVSERLPEFDEPVWVYCAIYGRFVATYEFVGDFDGVSYGNWRNSSNGEFGILPPTHWMPLPEPPKTENA